MPPYVASSAKQVLAAHASLVKDPLINYSCSLFSRDRISIEFVPDVGDGTRDCQVITGILNQRLPDHLYAALKLRLDDRVYAPLVKFLQLMRAGCARDD